MVSLAPRTATLAFLLALSTGCTTFSGAEVDHVVLCRDEDEHRMTFGEAFNADYLQPWQGIATNTKALPAGVAPTHAAMIHKPLYHGCIDAHGAVSEPVALAMARGALERTGSTCALAITGVAGSFAAILAGLDQLAAAGATVVTNTVVCAANVASLAATRACATEKAVVAASCSTSVCAFCAKSASARSTSPPPSASQPLSHARPWGRGGGRQLQERRGGGRRGGNKATHV